MRKPKKRPPVAFKFYTEKDYDFFLNLSREYSDNNAIAKIILYRINTVKTKSHSLYGESKSFQKEFLAPIELNVTMETSETTTEFMGKSSIYNEKINSLKFGVYIQELEEKNVTINRGDFFLYNDGEKDRQFEITKVDNIKSNNSSLGFKPAYVLIESTMVLENAIKL